MSCSKKIYPQEKVMLSKTTASITSDVQNYSWMISCQILTSEFDVFPFPISFPNWSGLFADCPDGAEWHLPSGLQLARCQVAHLDWQWCTWTIENIWIKTWIGKIRMRQEAQMILNIPVYWAKSKDYTLMDHLENKYLADNPIRLQLLTFWWWMKLCLSRDLLAVAHSLLLQSEGTDKMMCNSRVSVSLKLKL